MSERRVLITGAGGFVGRALTRGFSELGWSVTGLDLAFDTAAQDHRVRRLVVDLGSEAVPEEVPAPDVLVHAAWVTTDPEGLGVSDAEHLGLNLRPLLAVLEYAARIRVGAFVFLSSSGVFAPGDGAGGLTDAHLPSGASPYAVAKRAGELLVDAALGGPSPGTSTSADGARHTEAHVVRLGYLFGPDEAARSSRADVSLVARWGAAAREGRPLEVRADDPVRDWTFTPDLAPALVRVVEGPSAGRPIHLGSGHVMGDWALATLVAEAVSGAEIVSVPAAGPVKPPMVPSDLPGLRDFVWTDVAAGLRTLEEVTA